MTRSAGKLAKKSPAKVTAPNERPIASRSKPTATVDTQPDSKQARVLEMLRSTSGATIAGIMRETGWQQHSVRGFLAAVVRKRLGLNLQSKKADGERVYRVSSKAKTKPQAASKKRRV